MKLSRILHEGQRRPFKIERILANNPDIQVLFISDPVNGDTFEFGTPEELENELEAMQGTSTNAMISTGRELLQQLDFETYTQEPNVRM